MGTNVSQSRTSTLASTHCEALTIPVTGYEVFNQNPSASYNNNSSNNNIYSTQSHISPVRLQMPMDLLIWSHNAHTLAVYLMSTTEQITLRISTCRTITIAKPAILLWPALDASKLGLWSHLFFVSDGQLWFGYSLLFFCVYMLFYVLIFPEVRPLFPGNAAPVGDGCADDVPARDPRQRLPALWAWQHITLACWLPCMITRGPFFSHHNPVVGMTALAKLS